MRKTLLSTLALVTLLCGARTVAAQEAKPVVVVSIASYDNVLADVKFVGDLTNAPDMDKAFEGLIAFGTKGQGLKGFDKSKPIGAAVFMSQGPMPAGFVFVPTSDLKGLLSAVLPMPPEEKDGVLEISPPNGQTVYAVQKGAWAFISNDKESLKSVPADPLPLLDGLDKNYAVAVRLNVHNIPEATRSMGLQIAKSTVDSVLANNAGQDPAQAEVQRKAVGIYLRQFEMLVNELDGVTLGWAIDPSAKTTHLDISMTAVAETELAKKMATMTDGVSGFSGFLMPEAAATMNFNSKLAQGDIEQLVAILAGVRTKAEAGIDNDTTIPSDDGKKAAKKVVNELLDVAESTVKAGKMDGGAALVLEPNSLAFAAGGFVKDGAALETAIKNLVALGSADPNFPPVKFDADSYKGVRFHMVTIPVKDDEGAKKVFGDTLTAYLAVSDQSAYVAFGKGSLELLKKVIDGSAAGSSAPLPPMQLNIALTPILQFVNSMKASPMTELLAKLLTDNPGKDHVRITATSISNGVNYRIKVEEGILKAVGAAAKAAKGGGQG